ncbi:hypothetical protein EV132_12365 [Rhizobium sullae]|uniref:Uncharacterized protein n=1 Tax=Rhizobium sullae TaxID=50338 RepID=A0A4R3PT03_RHISU|nr:hypothetical protein EV132_12365 [Rhizobium sullae]
MLGGCPMRDTAPPVLLTAPFTVGIGVSGAGHSS